MMKQIIKHVGQHAGKTFSHMQPAAGTENAKENALDMAWPGGQKFSDKI